MAVEDCIIIGGGVLGRTVARRLESKGYSVKIFDDGRPNSGTLPSGGHLKPSWFGDMPKDQYLPSMQILEECWGLEKESYKLFGVNSKLTSVEIYRVDTDKVLQYPVIREKATYLKQLNNYPAIGTTSGEYRCRKLLVATGVWAYELLPGIQTKAKQGVSFRLHGVLRAPLVYPWAPYKQVVAHQQGDREVWVGDGTAVYPENWDDKRTTACLDRCLRTLGKGFTHRSTQIGWRPYAAPVNKGEPCLFQQVGQNAWVATGAGKSGTISAGWVAMRMSQILG